MKNDTNAGASNAGQANKTTIWFIVGLIVLVTAGVIIAGVYSSGTAVNNANSTFVSTTAPALTPTDWSEGNPNAKLVQNYSSTVLFVFRNFPLYTIHPFAGISAQAAEAAGLEGGAAKYWAMNDLLYSKQSEWSTNSALTPAQVLSQYVDGYAQSIGLDVNTFNTDMNATSVVQKIQTDVNGGTAAQIDHTPTFFLNLKQIPNPTGLSDFENTLNAAITSSTAGASSTAKTSSTAQ